MRGIWVVLILVVVGAAAYIGIFKREWFMSKVEDVQRKAKGYPPAKTYQEALDRFQKAIDERDYESAALFLGGDYASDMKKGAKQGREMATAIDALQGVMQNQGVKSDNVTAVLRLFEPFPKKIKFEKVTHKDGEDKATAILVEDSAVLKEANLRDRWNVDDKMFRPFLRGWIGAIPVTLKTEGEGDDKHWLIYFPDNKAVREAVNHFIEKYKGYVTALKTLKEDTNRDAGTKVTMEAELKRKLEESK